MSGFSERAPLWETARKLLKGHKVVYDPKVDGYSDQVYLALRKICTDVTTADYSSATAEEMIALHAWIKDNSKAFVTEVKAFAPKKSDSSDTEGKSRKGRQRKDSAE